MCPRICRKRQEAQGRHRRLHEENADHAQRHDEGQCGVARGGEISLTGKTVADPDSELRESYFSIIDDVPETQKITGALEYQKTTTQIRYSKNFYI